MMFEAPQCVRLWLRPIALVGIVVCSAWAIVYVCAGIYRDAIAFAAFAAVNGISYYQNRRR